LVVVVRRPAPPLIPFPEAVVIPRDCGLRANVNNPSLNFCKHSPWATKSKLKEVGKKRAGGGGASEYTLDTALTLFFPIIAVALSEARSAEGGSVANFFKYFFWQTAQNNIKKGGFSKATNS
jgi:hypothetical protein